MKLLLLMNTMLQVNKYIILIPTLLYPVQLVNICC